MFFDLTKTNASETTINSLAGDAFAVPCIAASVVATYVSLGSAQGIQAQREADLYAAMVDQWEDLMADSDSSPDMIIAQEAANPPSRDSARTLAVGPAPVDLELCDSG
eukprot:9963810-Alexandrium_andersonii.AAC.1